MDLLPRGRLSSFETSSVAFHQIAFGNSVNSLQITFLLASIFLSLFYERRRERLSVRHQTTFFIYFLNRK